MLNLANSLEDSARRFPNKEAIIFGDTKLTFKALNDLSCKIANGLKALGIQKGDKIALSCPNLPYFPAIYYGILKIGGVVVPLSILLKKDEVSYHLKDSEAKAIFCFEGNDALPMGIEAYEGFKQVDTCTNFITITANPTANTPFENTITLGAFISQQATDFSTIRLSAEASAVIIYTSGTTGRPKGAELSHSNLLWNTNICGQIFQFTTDDITLSVLPLFHVFGQVCLMNASIMYGITNAFLVRFDAQQVIDLMLKENVTVFAGVPTMYWSFINHKTKITEVDKIKEKLRLCISGGASLPVEVLKDFGAKYKVPILEGYGMSEGSPVVTFNSLNGKRKPGSIGKPIWGVEVKLANEDDNEVPTGEKGQLLYRGHNVMKGYYNRPEENAKTLKGGWLHSGDIAVKDEEGYYYIVDRTKDMIIRGGLNVYPREVEEILMQHEAVSLIAIIGIPDEKFGEEIKAYIVLNENVSITEADLIGWTKTKIAAYKYPRHIEFLDALPMSATGKILKKELRKGNSSK